MKKIKQSEIKAYRESLLIKQGGMCQLCGLPLAIKDAVLDHSHKSGQIRGVIHRNDNLLLGKIENSLVRNRITPEQLKGVTENLIRYLSSEIEVLHPTFLTPEERKQRSKDRAKRKRNKILFHPK